MVSFMAAVDLKAPWELRGLSLNSVPSAPPSARTPPADRSVSCLSHRAQQTIASIAEAEPNIARTPKRC
jgi:hypothetical protein